MLVSPSRPASSKLPRKAAKAVDNTVAPPIASSEQKDSVVLGALAKGWKKLQGQTSNAASVSTNLRLGSRQFRSLLGTGLASSLGVAGGYIGLAAAGLRAASGGQKLVQAVQKQEVSLGLDGVRDLGSAALLGLASASMFALRQAVLPVTGGFNTFRGGFNYMAGRKTGDKRRQATGALDAVRSLGLTARALKGVSPWFLTAGRFLAPVAGIMQAHQGSKTLASGLRQNKNKLELKGLVDIASAVGLTLLLTGAASVPGLAIFSTAQTVYSVYNMSKTAQKIMDKGIDKLEPAGLKTIDAVRDFKAASADALKRLKCPFPSLFGVEFGGDRGADETAQRLEEDGWQAYLAVWPDDVAAAPVAAMEAEPGFDEDLDYAIG